jgi:uncharacterized protein YjiK
MKIIHLLIITGILFGCSAKQNDKDGIKFIKSYNLSVPEPSGLVLTFDEKGFWTVSDENSTVYRLDDYGKVVKMFKVDGEDIEGITVVDEQTLAIVLERSREVVILDTSGNELRRNKLDLDGELNMGLEGITFNPNDSSFYVVNEMKPGLLIKLDFELNEVSRDTLDFAKDYSGICYDNINNVLWIVSDESKLIAKTDLSGNKIEKHKIDVIQAEGICIDKAGNRIYIVSDKKEALYVYEFKQ